jgi:hypothetical protein
MVAAAAVPDIARRLRLARDIRLALSPEAPDLAWSANACVSAK